MLGFADRGRSPLAPALALNPTCPPSADSARAPPAVAASRAGCESERPRLVAPAVVTADAGCEELRTAVEHAHSVRV